MKIGIDARLINETGVGRYIRNLIAGLQETDTKNRYVVYLTRTAYDAFPIPNSRWEKRLATVHWHTIAEQIVMPFLFLKDRLDLVHVPYFNAPVLYPGALALTVHDLTILHVTTGKATTLPYPLYLVRKLGYRIVLSLGIRNARVIFTPSNAVKDEILEHFRVNPRKIRVTYEGVDTALLAQESARGQGYVSDLAIPDAPYILYVGNAYPHKNLDLLVDAFRQAIGEGKKPGYLVFVGKDDPFYHRVRESIREQGLEGRTVFMNHVTDPELTRLYTHAAVLVMPSLMEGFGLPALEAASLGTPVICSDIPVFHEILGTIPTYVDPTDRTAFASRIREALSRTVSFGRTKAVRNSDNSLARFRWDTMVEQTLAAYETSQSVSV